MCGRMNLVHSVKQYGAADRDIKTVCNPGWNAKYGARGIRQMNNLMLPARGRACAKVEHHIHDSTMDTGDKFNPIHGRQLDVEATECVTDGACIELLGQGA
jgi:hypothetical protein